MSRWTAADVRNVRAKHLKPSKYRNVKVTVDGHVFDSKREAARYHELKLMQKAGQIFHLLLQPVFDIVVPGGTQEAEPVVVAKYVADFSYILPDRSSVVEDAKGMRTPVYRLKKKLVEATYGIKILET